MPSNFDTPANPEPEPPPRGVSPDDQLRVGDVERQEALTAIHQSYVEGRIDLQELEHRTAQAASAVTRGNLQSATAGLPNTQRIAQSFSSRLDELMAADLQRDVQQRQVAAAHEEVGAQEAADAAARLFREFATRLKGIVPPRPVDTGYRRPVPKKLFSRSSSTSEEIISPPGYQLYPNPGSDHIFRSPGVRGPDVVTVCAADGRIWQMKKSEAPFAAATKTAYAPKSRKEAHREWDELKHKHKQNLKQGVIPGSPTYWTGYVDVTPQLLFSAGGQSSIVRGGVFFHRDGLPWIRGSRGNPDNPIEMERRLDEVLAELAAEMIQKWRLGTL